MVIDALEHEPALLVESLSACLDELRPLGRELSLAPGDAVWSEGDRGDEVLVLVEGRLAVLRRTPSGEEVALRHLYPGAVAFEPSAVDGQPRLTSVRAHGPSRVVLVAMAGFREFLRRRSDLLERLFWLQVSRTRSLPSLALRERVLSDPTTGLYHEAFFRERLAIELERAQLAGDTLTVALFDVDQLGAYEKAHGREAAEQVLKRLAELLRKTGRRGDVAARFGDDEFVTLLYGASASDGWRFAETYRGAITATGVFGPGTERPRRITISGGIAAYPQDGQDEAALVLAARERVKRAKQSGRNCIVGVAARSG